MKLFVCRRPEICDQRSETWVHAAIMRHFDGRLL